MTRLGLISDTHMMQRLFSLPEKVLDVFEDVDLIMHAGDVGSLSVLDALSKNVSVIAVHGNDDEDTKQQELPQQQVVSVLGQRILL